MNFFKTIIVKMDSSLLTNNLEDQIPEFIGEYQLISSIWQGSNSYVWKAIHKHTKLTFAIKIISKNSLNNDIKITRLQREINLLKQIEHPFIIQIYEIIEDEFYYYLIMEFASGGSLKDLLTNKGPLIESLARKYFLQLFIALEYLHKIQKIAHRDLKSDNILLDKFSNIKLIDFGLSNQFNNENETFSTLCGSICM